MEKQYQYAAYLWGSIFNATFQNVHGKSGRLVVFDTEQERADYIGDLERFRKGKPGCVLVSSQFEGYDCDVPIRMVRVSEYKGMRKESVRETFISENLEQANYHMKYKWYPGGNHYPFGEDIDYSKVTTVSEHIHVPSRATPGPVQIIDVTRLDA